MYIAGRKNKTNSEKLIAEVTLFIAVYMSQAVVENVFNDEFSITSRRTIYRYIKDIALCGYEPRIYVENHEYTIGSMNDLTVQRKSPEYGNHISRLYRILRIYEAFSDEITEIMCEADENGTENVVLPFKPGDVIQLYPDGGVSTRTIQRDLEVLTAAVNHTMNCIVL